MFKLKFSLGESAAVPESFRIKNNRMEKHKGTIILLTQFLKENPKGKLKDFLLLVPDFSSVRTLSLYLSNRKTSIGKIKKNILDKTN